MLSHSLFFWGPIVLGQSLESATWAQAYCSHMTFVYSPTLLIALSCTEWERSGGAGAGCVDVMEQSEEWKWTHDWHNFPVALVVLCFLFVCVWFCLFLCEHCCQAKTEIIHMLKLAFSSLFWALLSGQREANASACRSLSGRHWDYWTAHPLR